jgi:hypothetical protein
MMLGAHALRLGLALAGSSLVAAPAAAQLPTAEEASRVLSYFHSGKGQGPLLLELTPCLEVARPEGEKRKRCTKTVTGPLKRGTTTFVYTRWMVPRDDAYDDILVRWTRNGATVEESAISVSTSWSYGVWKARGLSEAGTWRVEIRRGETILGSTEIVVE